MVELESHRNLKHPAAERGPCDTSRNSGCGSIPVSVSDGWFFSGGAEYIWSDQLTVRGGVGYEISPVTDQVRTPLVPDNDRFWASVGATWQVIKGIHFDVAYSHVWVRIHRSTSRQPLAILRFTGLTYIGNVNATSTFCR